MALPVGSVLVLDGAGADVCKHCVPGVSEDRISITFRRIDQRRARMAPFKGPWGEQGGGRRQGVVERPDSVRASARPQGVGPAAHATKPIPADHLPLTLTLATVAP